MGSLGMPEILMILVIALIIFGPRKLPELGKTLGQSLAQFRRASEDFKRQWEDEVELERRRIEPPSPAPVEHMSDAVVSDSAASESPASGGGEAEPATQGVSEPAPTGIEAAASVQHEATATEETKRDWM